MDRSVACKPIVSLAGLVAMASFAGAMPALADPVTFAQYTEVVTTTKNITFTNNTTSATLNTLDTTLGDHVSFSYGIVGVLPAALSGPQDAYLKINGGAGATTTEAAFPASNYNFQPFNNTITISFTRATDFIDHGIDYGKNLLTLTLKRLTPTSSDPALSSTGNGRNPVLSFDDETYSLVYSSDFLIFAPGSEEDGSITFSSATPPVIISGGFLRSFAANSTGTFASDPPPSAIIVPEPASLALLGVSLIGLSLVRRRAG